jgi:flagellar assembly factor FliW
MDVKTTRFGTLTIEPERIIHFPLGLVGFETLQRFVLIDSDEIAPMRWLQAVDEPSLAFLVVEPQLFFPDYLVSVTADERKVVGLGEADEAVVACLVVVPADPREMTINLMGPLIMNPEKRLGKQAVLHDSAYSPRQRLIPDTAGAETPALV